MDHMIEVENVSKNFKDTRALDDVSLAFEQNKIHGIIGRNGSGKTVLLKCICGFMIPDKGRISINGKRSRRRNRRISGSSSTAQALTRT